VCPPPLLNLEYQNQSLWAHLNGLLSKSLPSVFVCLYVFLLSLLGSRPVETLPRQRIPTQHKNCFVSCHFESCWVEIFGAHHQIFLFPFFCRTIALLFVLRRPLWREDGSVICSTICQWSESWRTHKHTCTLLFHLRLPCSTSVASYDSQGLWWKYSNSPPHGDKPKLKWNIIHSLRPTAHAPSL
jgi:hypothetical protein